MAKEKPQQSSLKKVLIFGLPILALVAFFPSGSSNAPKGLSKTQQALLDAKNGNTGSSKSKKVDPLDMPEDHNAPKFESVNASMKNTFVPLVTKKSGGNKTGLPGGIPAWFADGEGNWVYTGNMTVNGVPNALLENTASGEGVFLRPGQKWKSLKLVSVHEDSIDLEGPNNEHKTIFDEIAYVADAPISPLPPASPANIPGGNTTQPGSDGSGNGNRRRRGQNNGPVAGDGGLSGPIGGQAGAFGFTDQTGQ